MGNTFGKYSYVEKYIWEMQLNEEIHLRTTFEKYIGEIYLGGEIQDSSILLHQKKGVKYFWKFL